MSCSRSGLGFASAACAAVVVAVLAPCRWSAQAQAPVAGTSPSLTTLPTYAVPSFAQLDRARVMLEGRIKPDLQRPKLWFEYGPTPAYGQRAESPAFGSPSKTRFAQAQLDGLLVGEEYHYRLVADVGGVLLASGDRLFSTAPAPLGPPFALDLSATRGNSSTTIRSTLIGAKGRRVTVVRCRFGGGCDRRLQQIVASSNRQSLRSADVPRRSLLFVHVDLAQRGRLSFNSTISRAGTLDYGRSCDGVADVYCAGVDSRSRGGRRLEQLLLEIPPLARASLLCTGPGCPLRELSVKSDRTTRKLYTPATVLRQYRHLRAGARLRVDITRPSTIGLRRTFRITRRGVSVGGYDCLTVGSSLPQECPDIAGPAL